MKTLTKYILSFILTFSFLLPISQHASAAGISVYINGQKQIYDQPPVSDSGRTLVPLRGIFESLGANVTWDSKTNKITAAKEEKIVTLTIGSKTTYINNIKTLIDVPAKVVNNRTLVPLRFVSEAFEAQVQWDGATQRVNITYNENMELPSKELTISEIVNLNDTKVVKIETNKGQGSGVFVGEGLILTNAHVVDQMTDAAVYFSESTLEWVDGIVAYDKDADLALLKLQHPMNIDPVTIGSSYDLVKGDNVVAIGSPLGFQNTVSDGIVSNLYELDGIRVIQNTASTDHGSSGGGLFNMKGELVGITSSGIDGSNADINFSIAIEEANQWKSYFSMNHSQLPVMDWNPLGPELLSGVSLGMTKEEVKEIEVGTLVEEGADYLLYSNITFMDYPVSAEYVFENGSLVGLDVYFDNTSLFDRSEAEDLFYGVTYELEEIYGYADEYDLYWSNDGPNPELAALWYGDSTDVPAIYFYIYENDTYEMESTIRLYISLEHIAE
jgi:hypothetical protein